MSKLPQLPSLDDLDEKKESQGNELPEIPDLPDLPSLDGLDLPEIDGEFEVVEQEDANEVDDFEEEYEEQIEEEYEEDEIEEYEDEENFDEENFEEYEEDYEGDGELLSFLPPADVDEVPVPEEVEEEFEEYNDSEEQEIQSESEPSDSNEIDEEKIKEFFTNLKNKIFKGSNESKTKIHKGKKEIPSDKLGIGITILVIIGMVIGLIVFSKSFYKPITSLNKEVSSDSNKIEVSTISYEDDILITKVKNIGDMSAEFTMDLELATQGKIPFISGDSVTCQSGIVVLDLDEEQEVTLTCEHIIPDKDVRVSIDIDDLN